MNIIIDTLKTDTNIALQAYFKSKADIVLFYHFETIKEDILKERGIYNEKNKQGQL